MKHFSGNINRLSFPMIDAKNFDLVRMDSIEDAIISRNYFSKGRDCLEKTSAQRKPGKSARAFYDFGRFFCGSGGIILLNIRLHLEKILQRQGGPSNFRLHLKDSKIFKASLWS